MQCNAASSTLGFLFSFSFFRFDVQGPTPRKPNYPAPDGRTRARDATQSDEEQSFKKEAIYSARSLRAQRLTFGDGKVLI